MVAAKDLNFGNRAPKSFDLYNHEETPSDQNFELKVQDSQGSH